MKPMLLRLVLPLLLLSGALARTHAEVLRRTDPSKAPATVGASPYNFLPHQQPTPREARQPAAPGTVEELHDMFGAAPDQPLYREPSDQPTATRPKSSRPTKTTASSTEPPVTTMGELIEKCIRDRSYPCDSSDGLEAAAELWIKLKDSELKKKKPGTLRPVPTMGYFYTSITRKRIDMWRQRHGRSELVTDPDFLEYSTLGLLADGRSFALDTAIQLAMKKLSMERRGAEKVAAVKLRLQGWEHEEIAEHINELARSANPTRYAPVTPPRSSASTSATSAQPAINAGATEENEDVRATTVRQWWSRNWKDALFWALGALGLWTLAGLLLGGPSSGTVEESPRSCRVESGGTVAQDEELPVSHVKLGRS